LRFHRCFVGIHRRAQPGRQRLAEVELGFIVQRLAGSFQFAQTGFGGLDGHSHGVQCGFARGLVLGLSGVAIDQVAVAPHGIELGGAGFLGGAFAGFPQRALFGGQRGRHDGPNRAVLVEDLLFLAAAFGIGRSAVRRRPRSSMQV
jgi:hypothetical protein